MKPELPVYVGKNHSLNFIGGLGEGGTNYAAAHLEKHKKIVAFHTLKDRISRIKW
jgi:hypothetical protein